MLNTGEYIVIACDDFVFLQRQHLEKLQARKMRFQQSSATPSSATAATTCQPASSTSNGTKVSTSSLSLQERKRLRAERFKINT